MALREAKEILTREEKRMFRVRKDDFLLEAPIGKVAVLSPVKEFWWETAAKEVKWKKISEKIDSSGAGYNTPVDESDIVSAEHEEKKRKEERRNALPQVEKAMGNGERFYWEMAAVKKKEKKDL